MHRRDFIKGAAAAPFCFGPDAWAAISDEGPQAPDRHSAARRGRRAQCRNPLRRRGLLPRAPIDRDRTAGQAGRGIGARRAFRVAPGPREPDAAMDRAQARLCSRRGFARSDAIAFRRAALSRKRHPGAGHHPRRLDEPPAAGAARSARRDRRDQHRPDRAAHSGGQGARRHPAARPQRRPAVADRSAGNRQRLRSALFRQ